MKRRLATDTELWCSACKAMHPRTAFGNDKSTADGAARTCKTVVAEQNRTHHRKNRTALNARSATRRQQRKASPERVDWAIKKLVGDAARRAKAKGLEFSITASAVDRPSHCPLLGCELVYQATGRRLTNSASIDRIDSRLGYVPSNVWIVSWRANQIKSDATLSELRQISLNLGRLLDGVEHNGFPDR